MKKILTLSIFLITTPFLSVANASEAGTYQLTAEEAKILQSIRKMHKGEGSKTDAESRATIRLKAMERGFSRKLQSSLRNCDAKATQAKKEACASKAAINYMRDKEKAMQRLVAEESSRDGEIRSPKQHHKSHQKRFKKHPIDREHPADL